MNMRAFPRAILWIWSSHCVSQKNEWDTTGGGRSEVFRRPGVFDFEAHSSGFTEFFGLAHFRIGWPRRMGS